MSRPFVDRLGVIRPLRIRDFRLLWTGMTVSLIGDGIYLIAVAWQAYELSNSPTALSLVGLSQSIPLLAFILLGGVLSDRFERRRLMIVADVARGVAVGTIGLISVAGHMTLPILVALVGLYGFGQAMFYPAFGAIVPELVPADLLVQANSLDQFVRPFAYGILGPALGGAAISGISVGAAFLFDAGTFVVSGICLLLMQQRTKPRREEGAPGALREVLQGLRFVRSQPWLWATLLSAATALLMFVGPFEVLVPFVVKFQLDGSAGDLGSIFAAGGVGSIIAAVVMGQVGWPKRYVTFMYVSWFVAVLAVAGYGLMTALWQGMLIRGVAAGLATAGTIVWGTLMHRHVPSHLLGRVTSLDWLVSLSLIPLSFSITGPIAEVIGADTTLILGGVLGAMVTIAFLFVPGVRDLERRAEP
ncbi:MAG: MFS transporter [Actinobacteria bacterium]|nr:MFS transporter [Actinomycetota bacterium]